MRRVWAALLAVWATLAIVGVLAWSHRPAAPLAQASPVTFVVQGRNGSRQVFVLPAGAAGAPHATTQTSPTSASLPQAAGNVLVAAAPASAHAATRTS